MHRGEKGDVLEVHKAIHSNTTEVLEGPIFYSPFELGC